jgi:hypothetical protein
MVRIVTTAALALLTLGPATVLAQGEEPLPRDRQVLLERNLGHLSPVDDVSCIQRRRISNLVVISDQRILFSAGRNLVYENSPSPACDGLARSPYAPSVAHGRSQICAGDVLEVVNLGRTSSCVLGSFRVWQRPQSGSAPD